MTGVATKPSTFAIAAALVSVYVIWGSTYLAIALGIHTMPPFLMMGARWLVAGALLYIWRRASGDGAPTRLHWRSGLVIGALMILGGNGTVAWAEQHLASGLTALLIAIVPVWIALFEWLRPGGMRPAARVGVGVLLGVAGVVALVYPTLGGGADPWAPVAALAILGATLAWVGGSLYSRKAPLPESALLGASLEMLCGGALLTLVGLATGEGARVDLAGVDATGWISFGFLVLFGSIVAYSAYVWLLKVVRPQLVGTYAFVNPVVAVFLGALVAKEPLTPATLFAAGLIIAAVGIVVTAPRLPVDERPPRPGIAPDQG